MSKVFISTYPVSLVNSSATIIFLSSVKYLTKTLLFTPLLELIVKLFTKEIVSKLLPTSSYNFISTFKYSVKLYRISRVS